MLNVIPIPYEYKEKYGEFIINSGTTIYADAEFVHCRELLQSIVERSCGYRPNAVVSRKANIRFLMDTHVPQEGYRIKCSSELMEIFASTFQGGFYAVQTIRQLLSADTLTDAQVLSMHAVDINDKPRFKWRALMLDESRWFFGADTVKRLLELMAMHKLNVLHWHLTDDEGWRIEINKYPKLAEIASKRTGTQNLAWGKRVSDNIPHLGYYTQAEIKEIVNYAGKLNIMIVPEIDMPAHFGAAIAAYPELSCAENEQETPVIHNGNKGIIACAGKETTYKFVYDVLDEISELFPAPYFHIGGDEAPKGEWKKCSYCQEAIKKNGLKDEEELQGFFNNKIALYLKEKGKRMIGWNEILTANILDKGTVAEYWTPTRDKNAEKYLEDGGNLILAKHQAFYFDMPYSMRNLSATYAFEPSKFNLTEEKGILGVEAPLWSEWIHSTERLDFQLFPRMEAFAEVAWSKKEDRNYREFTKRLKKFLPILDAYNVTYCPLTMVNRRGLFAKLNTIKFITKDAHCEYKRAIQRNKRRR